MKTIFPTLSIVFEKINYWGYQNLIQGLIIIYLDKIAL